MFQPSKCAILQISIETQHWIQRKQLGAENEKNMFVSFWKYRFGSLDPAWKFLHPKGWHLLEWDKVSAFASFGHAFGHNQAEACPDQLDREIPNCPLLRFQIPYLWRLISYIWTWYIFQFIKSGAIEKNVKMSIQTVFWSVGSDGEDE